MLIPVFALSLMFSCTGICFSDYSEELGLV